MNEEVLSTFVNYLPVLRAASKMSQEDLGKMLGITKEAISNLETGKTKFKLHHYIAMRTIFEEISSLNQDDLITYHVLDLVDSKMNKSYRYWFEAILDI